MEMDLKLKNAAERGDVKFLEQAFAREPLEYFLAQDKWRKKSIFHIAIENQKVNFIKEAMEILPSHILKQILLIKDGYSDTPLHFLSHVRANNFKVTKCVVDMYASFSWDDDDDDDVKPWLALNYYNQTPLNVCLKYKRDEKSLMKIMSLDPSQQSWTIADNNGNTPLYYAVNKELNLVAQKIVMSTHAPTSLVSSSDFPTLFTKYSDRMEMEMDLKLKNTAECGDVKFLEQAFAREPLEYFLAQDRRKRSIFHIAIENQNVNFIKEAMKILPSHILKQILLIKDGYSETPLHFLSHVRANNFKVTKCVVDMYASFSWDDDEDDHVKPWLALNDYNQTPLNASLKQQRDEKCLMKIMSLDPSQESWTIADKSGNTPLSYAVDKELNLVAEKIVISTRGPTSLVSSSDFPTLFTKYSGNIMRLLKKSGYVDNDGNSPLHLALYSRSTEEVALLTLSTYPALRLICNNKGESPFFLAVRSGSEQVVHRILSIREPRFHMLRRYDKTTVLHHLSSCTEKTGLMLLEIFWWIINLRDDEGKTALYYAKQEKTDWLVNLLTNPSIIRKQDFDWMEACKREESDAVLAFIDSCQDLQRVCRNGNDTLLHHVKLATYKDYQNFLKIPSIAKLKNTLDYKGATPLHSALRREEMNLARALLCDNEVNRIIPDNYDITSMDLLAELCEENDDWENMCQEINVNPNLKTKYIQPGTNLEQMRNTLSVIAALLATITFAAGFALPGGINSANGQALLGKKAAFLVFLLADAYAMCTSMLVLFCMVWSMVSKPDMAILLVDRSVLILMHSLYATLLAYMTGVYAVIEHSSLWATIVIFVMCSFIGILANRTILHKVISKLIPGADRKKHHKPQTEEQELLEVKTETGSDDDDETIE